MKKYKYILAWLLIIFSLYACLPVLAASVDIDSQLKEAGETSGPFSSGNEFSLAEIVGYIIRAFFGILGMIFIILILTAGYNYMNARGDEERVDKALTTIRRAIIGLIITVGAYAIWAFVFERLFNT